MGSLPAKQGWTQETASNGSARLARGIFQVYDSWYDESEVKSLDQLIKDAQWVNGIAFNSLQKLILYKSRRGQAKDLVDLDLIKQYLDN